MTTNLFNSLTLAQLFGKDSYQDTNTLVITKSSLLRLTPSQNNSAESLLAAILITSLENFQGIITDENNQRITNEDSQAIEFNNSDFFETLMIMDWKAFQFMRGSQKYINNQIIASIYAPN